MSFGLLLTPPGAVARTTRLQDVITALLESWRSILAPGSWTVVDGPMLGVGETPQTVSIGVGNEVEGDPYRVEVTESDLLGRRREDGVIRCQIAAVAADARDLALTRALVLDAFATIDLALRGGLLDVDRVALGGQRWWHLADEAAQRLVIACDIEVRWTAYL